MRSGRSSWIARSEAYQEERPERIVLLTLTDYDPAGRSISKSQHDQLCKAALAMQSAGELSELENVLLDRIGLKPSQLTAAEIAANSYELKEKGLSKWMEKTNGIDGQPLGLELDALPLSRLRGMFAGAIEEYVDLEARRDDLRAAYVDLLAWKALDPIVEHYEGLLMNAVRDAGLWEAVQSAEIPDGLFKTAAKKGFGDIDPVRWHLFNEHKEAIQDVILRTLEKIDTTTKTLEA